MSWIWDGWGRMGEGRGIWSFEDEICFERSLNALLKRRYVYRAQKLKRK